MMTLSCEDFFTWFECNASSLHSMPSLQHAATIIQGNLKGIIPSVLIELHDRTEVLREMIISANGDSTKFGSIKRLVSLAPVFPGWSLIALSPARGFRFKTEADGEIFQPSYWQFQPLATSTPIPGMLDIRLLIPGNTPMPSDFLMAVILQTGIGEEAFACLGRIEILIDHPPRQNVYPLTQLGSWISHFKK